MSSILAIHHSENIGGYIADKYGNDPFVWVEPFLWSHCHARSRQADFGLAKTGSLVFGKDTVFWVSIDQRTDELFCDCIFVVDKFLKIEDAENKFAASHPARHYHFDQKINPYHAESARTFIANSNYSFVIHPPMPIGSWIDEHVEKRKLSVLEYFRMGKRKNVRIITARASEIYERAKCWCAQPNHSEIGVLPLNSLKSVSVLFPTDTPIKW